ncbi:hypothetical protein [Novosphingobium sp. TH158]|uniref:hypothetical protein n=1 Tax=Novosphingobium sp. TH158 TaxID=2067455 RepID=UPI000C7C01B9|nr:hypothetical protein [Novosphingobium sp. TH158]PLK27174.1 hypothetical protein C0V78_09975 [Novosphingobium sp. TH158]
MRLTIALSLAVLAGSVPALAQDNPNEKVNAVIVYGDDECPKPVGDEITICARKEEKERFRIPKGLRETPSATSESWNSRVLAYERVGKTGTMSCTPTGAGGWTGCSQRLIDQAYAEKQGEDMSFAKIIEEERAKRTATIDADAAATQARVEALEKEIEAKQRAEAEAAEAAKQAPAAPPK